MKLELVWNWRKILTRSWSIWVGAYLPLAWLLVPEILYAAAGIEMNPYTVWAVAFALAAVFPLARIVKQQRVSG